MRSIIFLKIMHLINKALHALVDLRTPATAIWIDFPADFVFSDQWGRFSHGSEVSPKPFRSNPGSLQKTLRIRSQLGNLKFHKNIRAHGIHSLPTLETRPSRASGKLSIVRRTNPSRYRVNQLIFEVNSKLIHRKCQQQSNIFLRN